MGILLPAITVVGFDVKLSPLLILIKEDMVLTLHTTEVKRFFRLRRYAKTFMHKLPARMLKADKNTLLLVRLIDENNSRNFEHLLEIEEQGDRLSQWLADPKTPRDIIGTQIHEMKHALITYLGGLWATVDVLNSVCYGDADLLTSDDKILDKLTGLLEEVNSHIGLAEHLSEVLASGLEVVQSIYNNQLQILNNQLALLVGYLTIIGTALLVPNTIATAMGSPVFNLGPEDLWWYLTILVVSTIVSTLIAWYVIKRIGLLPHKGKVD
jgi:magnesium transporter